MAGTKTGGQGVVNILRISLYVNLATLFIFLGSAVYLAWQNAGSRNLALAVGTLAAAVILFVIQLRFELRPSTADDHVSAELTIDRAKPEIRQWDYTGSGSWRMSRETNASSWLAANNPAAFEQDREKLATDFVLFSLASFLATTEFDWQLRKIVYGGKSSGSVTTVEGVSGNEECSVITVDDLRLRLGEAQNVFAGAPFLIVSGRLCLPPRSALEISANSLIIRNPVCQLCFRIEPFQSAFFDKPRSGGEVAQLPGGGHRYETRLIGLKVQTLFFALRAQHRDSEKYREWTARLIGNARDWFEN